MVPENVCHGKALSFSSTRSPGLINSTSDWSMTITASKRCGSPTMQSTVPSWNVAPMFFLPSALPVQVGSLPPCSP